nr:MAG TPA_asm: hypothetical protein [Caudoviricetes sp.]
MLLFLPKIYVLMLLYYRDYEITKIFFLLIYTH